MTKMFHLFDLQLECDEACQWEREQKRRKATLNNYCANTKRPQVDWSDWLNSHPNWLNNILISDKHKLLYCYIPKVSSTTWKTAFLYLNGEFHLGEHLPKGIIHQRTTNLAKYARQKNLTFDELRMRLDTYTSFLFVRNPFIRALSAYRHKFLTHDGPLVIRLYESKMKEYGRQTHQVNNGKPETNEASSQEEHTRVTFPEFVKFLSDHTERMYFDEHWAPFSDICAPCQMNYTIIGKLETIETDARFIFDKIGVAELADLGEKKASHATHSDGSDEIRQFYSTLSEEDIDGLKRKYFDDCHLFDYDFPANNYTLHH